jgi:hypothetical protein
MKKLLLLICVVFISLQTQAQNMPIPSSSASNTLFLKFSHVLNSPHAYISSHDISTSNIRDYKPVYSFISGGVMNTSMSILMNWFYAIDPSEFAYIDPTIYDTVSLNREQLVNILKTKTTDDGKNYLNGFSTIYLIDYEQKNPSNPNQVKILKVKPYYNFFR